MGNWKIENWCNDFKRQEEFYGLQTNPALTTHWIMVFQLEIS